MFSFIQTTLFCIGEVWAILIGFQYVFFIQTALFCINYLSYVHL